MPVHELRVLAYGTEARMVTWLCPHDGEVLRARALITEFRRQCKKCGREWDAKGFPIKSDRTHNKQAVQV